MHLENCKKPKCIAKWKGKQERRSNQTPTPPSVAPAVAAGTQLVNVIDTVDTSEVNIRQYYQGFQMLNEVRPPVPERPSPSPSSKLNKDFLLFDSDSSHHMFCNPRYLLNIRKAKVPIRSNTNGGIHLCEHEGFFPGIGWGYYNADGIANIVSMGLTEQQ